MRAPQAPASTSPDACTPTRRSIRDWHHRRDDASQASQAARAESGFVEIAPAIPVRASATFPSARPLPILQLAPQQNEDRPEQPPSPLGGKTLPVSNFLPAPRTQPTALRPQRGILACVQQLRTIHGPVGSRRSLRTQFPGNTKFRSPMYRGREPARASPSPPGSVANSHTVSPPTCSARSSLKTCPTRPDSFGALPRDCHPAPAHFPVEASRLRCGVPVQESGKRAAARHELLRWESNRTRLRSDRAEQFRSRREAQMCTSAADLHSSLRASRCVEEQDQLFPERWFGFQVQCVASRREVPDSR